MIPAELVTCARGLACEPNRRLGATALLAGVLLLRQGLEDALDQFWRTTVPGMEMVSGRAQLISLGFYLDDSRLAADVTYAWHRLSDTCHHDAYELPPSLDEFGRLAEVVERLVRATARA